MRFGNVEIVPLNCKWREAKLIEKLKQVDGLFLTGGSRGLYIKEKKFVDKYPGAKAKKIKVRSPLFMKIKALIDETVKMNEQGRYFPIWGTCFGFQVMILSFADEDFRMNRLNNKYYRRGFVLTDEYGNKIYEGITSNVFTPQFSKYNFLTESKISPIQKLLKEKYYYEKWIKKYYYKHQYGFKLRKFKEHEPIMDNYKILAVSDLTDFRTSLPPIKFKNTSKIKDRYSTMFIAAVEHKKYPFFAV